MGLAELGHQRLLVSGLVEVGRVEGQHLRPQLLNHSSGIGRAETETQLGDRALARVRGRERRQGQGTALAGESWGTAGSSWTRAGTTSSTEDRTGRGDSSTEANSTRKERSAKSTKGGSAHTGSTRHPPSAEPTRAGHGSHGGGVVVGDVEDGGERRDTTSATSCRATGRGVGGHAGHTKTGHGAERCAGDATRDAALGTRYLLRRSLLRLLRGENIRTCTSSTLRVRASGAERIVVDESGEVHYAKTILTIYRIFHSKQKNSEGWS